MLLGVIILAFCYNFLFVIKYISFVDTVASYQNIPSIGRSLNLLNCASNSTDTKKIPYNFSLLPKKVMEQ